MSTQKGATPKWRYELVDWFYAHQEAEQSKITRQAHPDSQGFINFLWPASNKYYSPLNPVFVSELFSPEILERHHVWQIRDGLVPLMWFFKSTPEPYLTRQKLLIDSSFSPFVPTPWRKFCGTFEVESDKSMYKGKPEQLLFLGLPAEAYCSLEKVEEYLEKIVDIVGATRIRSMKKLGFMVGKHFGFGVQDNQSYYPEFITLMGDYLGTKNFEFLNWNTFESTVSFTGYDVFDFNEKLLSADSYLMHLVLQKGARLLEGWSRKSRSTGGELVRLSPHHLMRVKETLTGKYALSNPRSSSKGADQYFSHFESAMRSQANLGMPWPNWAMEWSKTIAIENKPVQLRTKPTSQEFH